MTWGKSVFPDVDAWWTRNERFFEKAGMSFAGHACVCASKGRLAKYGYVNEDLVEQSKALLEDLIIRQHGLDGWQKVWHFLLNLFKGVVLWRSVELYIRLIESAKDHDPSHKSLSRSLPILQDSAQSGPISSQKQPGGGPGQSPSFLQSVGRQSDWEESWNAMTREGAAKMIVDRRGGGISGLERDSDKRPLYIHTRARLQALHMLIGYAEGFYNRELDEKSTLCLGQLGVHQRRLAMRPTRIFHRGADKGADTVKAHVKSRWCQSGAKEEASAEILGSAATPSARKLTCPLVAYSSLSAPSSRTVITISLQLGHPYPTPHPHTQHPVHTLPPPDLLINTSLNSKQPLRLSIDKSMSWVHSFVLQCFLEGLHITISRQNFNLSYWLQRAESVKQHLDYQI
ncbi:hypothetical protein BDZ97DRAFT_1758620 [Flammula alnicola]|nr:hypothetical protein BDZ97DRAFT_1758620 [Flammula alnicola]